MFGSPWWHLNSCKAQGRTCCFCCCAGKRRKTRHNAKHLLMLHLHQRDTWLRLSSHSQRCQSPTSWRKGANKKGEMSAVHWVKGLQFNNRRQPPPLPDAGHPAVSQTHKEHLVTQKKRKFIFVSRITAAQGQKCHNPEPSGNVNYCTSGGNQREWLSLQVNEMVKYHRPTVNTKGMQPLSDKMKSVLHSDWDIDMEVGGKRRNFKTCCKPD